MRATSWIQRSATAVGLGWLVFLLLPLLSLAASTSWTHFALASGDMAALTTSVVYTAVAMLIVVGFGTPLAFALARHCVPAQRLVEGLLMIPLLTPPLALGILLTSLYGPYGWLGGAMEHWGVSLTNSGPAFVLAQVYASAPYYVVGARAAFDGVPAELEQIARTLGDGPLRVFRRVTLPLSALGLGAALSIAWVRALGEFGVVLIMAYFPQGIPVKLWVNLQDYGLSSVYPLLWVFFMVGLPLPLLLGLLAHQRSARRPALPGAVA